MSRTLCPELGSGRKAEKKDKEKLFTHGSSFLNLLV
jgi:hypothetical protein